MARKIEFDRDKALHQSMMLFWQKGYENTSMQDLVDALEINRFSIYNTFGDKKTLFLLAIKQYRQQIFEELNVPLMDENIAPMVCLDNYISIFGHHLSSLNGELGCLIQNCSMSDIRHEPEIDSFISDALHSLESALTQTLQRALDQGQLNKECKPQLAALHIMSTMQGLILLRKFGKSPELINKQVNFLKQTVATWNMVH